MYSRTTDSFITRILQFGTRLFEKLKNCKNTVILFRQKEKRRRKKKGKGNKFTTDRLSENAETFLHTFRRSTRKRFMIYSTQIDGHRAATP